MALINCPECGKQVSEKAPTCPQCGSPIAPAKKEKKEAKQYGCGTLILALILLGVFISAISPEKKQVTRKTEAPQKSQAAAKPKTAAEVRTEKLAKCFSSWDGSHRNLERAVKASMNDPDSYDHEETRYSDKGDYLIVRMTFRGKNAFGGVVKNSVTAKTDMQCNVVEIMAQEP